MRSRKKPSEAFDDAMKGVASPEGEEESVLFKLKESFQK